MLIVFSSKDRIKIEIKPWIETEKQLSKYFTNITFNSSDFVFFVSRRYFRVARVCDGCSRTWNQCELPMFDEGRKWNPNQEPFDTLVSMVPKDSRSYWLVTFYLMLVDPKEPILLFGSSGFKTFLSREVLQTSVISLTSFSMLLSSLVFLPCWDCTSCESFVLGNFVVLHSSNLEISKRKSLYWKEMMIYRKF